MMDRKVTMTALNLLLIVLAGMGVYKLKSSQRLGEPGVLIAKTPIFDPDGGVAGEQSVPLPEAIPGYKSEPMAVSHEELGWLPPDTTFGKRRYIAEDSFWLDLGVVVMGTDRGSIHKPQICLVGQGWQIKRSKPETVRILDPHPYDLRVMRLDNSITLTPEDGSVQTWSGVFVYWFVADGQLTPFHGERMWWMARDMVLEGILQRWAYVTVFAVCQPGQEDATFDRMKDFIAEAAPEFQLTAGANVAEARVVETEAMELARE